MKENPCKEKFENNSEGKYVKTFQNEYNTFNLFFASLQEISFYCKFLRDNFWNQFLLSVEREKCFILVIINLRFF